MKAQLILIIGIILFGFSACDPNETPPVEPVDPVLDLTNIDYNPSSYTLNFPSHFPQMEIPADNPLTIDGVELGRHLFYDPILSVDSTISCSSCHLPHANFTDNLKVSPGVDGRLGNRSSMSLLNIGFNNEGLFWDGRVISLEEQALLPIEDPLEMNNTWENVISKLSLGDRYPEMFRKAFGIEKSDEITKELAAKAIAQFERTLVSSGNSRYDRWKQNIDVLSDEEQDGFEIFFDINPVIANHAECGHCHNAELFTTNEYFNNGLDRSEDLMDFADQGRGEVTGVKFDNGTFRVPTLRNIEFSAPYMHDGRFSTLDEVIDHYVTGGHYAPNLAPVLRPLTLGAYQREALVAFIRSLQDDDFMENPAFNSPFE